MTEKRLILMVGQPGVGKSTYIKEQIENNSQNKKIAVVSRDAIRFSLLEEGEKYFSKEKDVFLNFIAGGLNALNDNDEVYMDATHLNPSSRAKILNHFKDIPNLIFGAVYIKAPVELAIAQNEQRKGTRGYVPVDVIQKFFNAIVPPDFSEGFDEITIIHKEVVS